MGGVTLDRMLAVDLDDRRIDDEAIPAGWQQRYLGGKGLGARYLYDRVGPHTDALSPANVLVLTVGPLTGHLPGDGRFAAITKSPLTGLFLDSYAGGTFGTSFRAAMPDYAGIILEGTTDRLSVLDLRGAQPTLTDASSLAGEPVDRVDNAFPDASVLAVGPAGESGVPFATIAGDGGDHHAGRGGAGAVLGTKGVKAIVLPQTETLETSDSAIIALRERLRSAYEESAYGAAHRSSGTLESVEFANSTGMLSSRAWQDRGFSGAADLGIDAVRQATTGRERPDSDIPGDFVVPSDAGETVMRGGTPIALGASIGLDEFDAVATLGATCDRLGLDVISAGNVVALAMLASERGHLDRTLSFGSESQAKELLEEIATRSSPLGTVLAEGVEGAAVALDLEETVPTVKAMAVPSFDPRGAPAMALAYATSDRGACHRRAVPATAQVFEPDWTPTQTAEAIRTEQDRRAALWCLIVDDLATPLVGDFTTDWATAIGIESRRELDRLGRRTWTLTRLFNVREGITRADDRLPAAFTSERGIDPVWFERARRRYYELREWDRLGRPSRRVLDRLDLLGLVDDETPIGSHPLHPIAG